MGCSFVKSEDKEKNEGGTSNAAAASAGDSAVAAPDSRLPLNARQLFSVTKSWKGIARALEPTGVEMFVRLFNDHIELLDLFANFQDLRTRESQRESMELAEHAGKVMETLDESISTLEKVDCFIEFLHSISRMHTKIPGFKKEYFWKIEKPFLDAVKETLGDRYTDNMDTIYRLTIHFILETLIEGFGDAEAPPLPPKANSTVSATVEPVANGGDNV